MLKKRKEHDLDPSKGRAWAYVTKYTKEHDVLMLKVLKEYIHTSMHNPNKIPSI